MQYENQILKSELEAEHFILTQMAELGKVRNVRECQVAINNLLEKIGHFTKADRAYIVDEKTVVIITHMSGVMKVLNHRLINFRI